MSFRSIGEFFKNLDLFLVGGVLVFKAVLNTWKLARSERPKGDPTHDSRVCCLPTLLFWTAEVAQGPAAQIDGNCYRVHGSIAAPCPSRLRIGPVLPRVPIHRTAGTDLAESG